MKSISFVDKSKIIPMRVKLDIKNRPKKSTFFDGNRVDGDIVGGGTVPLRGSWYVKKYGKEPPKTED